jgi:hypothetical protein
MTVKSFGCSFIFGSDLADDGKNTRRPTPSQLTWPALLSRHLQRSYQCYARPGSGNLQILERLLNQVPMGDQSDLFVIGWTWIDRFDYWDADHDPNRRLTPWHTIMPIDTDNLAKTYYRELHSEYRDKFTSLCYIKLAIDTLHQYKIPFVMTYQDELLFDQRWHISESVTSLQNYIRPYMTTFDGKTFLDWSRSQGFEISPAWHPLESAHAAAAELLISYNLV